MATPNDHLKYLFDNNHTGECKHPCSGSYSRGIELQISEPGTVTWLFEIVQHKKVKSAM